MARSNGVCHHVWRFLFDSWAPHGGRRELTLKSCPLTPICRLWHSRGWGRRITPSLKSSWALIKKKKLKWNFQQWNPPRCRWKALVWHGFNVTLSTMSRHVIQLWCWEDTGLLRVIRWPLQSTTSAWGRRGDQRRHQHLAVSLAVWSSVLTWCLPARRPTPDLSLEPWTWAVRQNKPLFLLNYAASGTSLY